MARRRFSPEKKLEIVLEAIRDEGIILKEFFDFISIGKHTDDLIKGNPCSFDTRLTLTDMRIG